MRDNRLLSIATSLLSFLGVTGGILGIIYGFTLVINAPLTGIAVMVISLVIGLLLVAFSEACSILADILSELQDQNAAQISRDFPPQLRRK